MSAHSTKLGGSTMSSKLRNESLGLNTDMARRSGPPPGTAEIKTRHRRIDDETVIEEMYRFGKKLGEGSFGVVIEAENLETGDKWAIKKVNKEKAGRPSITLLEREVVILKRVRHQHIIHLEEVFETPKKMYLVMELCVLGELRVLLFSKGPFSETSARHIIKCLTDAIVYLHRNGIVHRDLKLENILVAGVRHDDKEDPLYDIKLTDFGLSVVKDGVGSDSMLQSTCGTPVYMAPEVIQNHDYSQQCDNWSIGVILYALLARDFPFVADKEERLYELIKKGAVDFSKKPWKMISDTAKTLIRKLLNVDPAYRLTASEVYGHPWTNGSLDETQGQPTNVLDLMKVYREEMAMSGEENNGLNDTDGESNNDDDWFAPTPTLTTKRPESSGSSDASIKHQTVATKPPRSTKTAALHGKSVVGGGGGQATVDPSKLKSHSTAATTAGSKRSTGSSSLRKINEAGRGSVTRQAHSPIAGAAASVPSNRTKSARSPPHPSSRAELIGNGGGGKARTLSATPYMEAPAAERRSRAHSPQPPPSPLLNAARAAKQQAPASRQKKALTGGGGGAASSPKSHH